MEPKRRNTRPSTIEPERIEDTEWSSRSGTPGSDADAGSYDDRVARRAYQRYEERGGDHGRDQEDWFEAERELTDTPTE